MYIDLDLDQIQINLEYRSRLDLLYFKPTKFKSRKSRPVKNNLINKIQIQIDSRSKTGNRKRKWRQTRFSTRLHIQQRTTEKAHPIENISLDDFFFKLRQ